MCTKARGAGLFIVDLRNIGRLASELKTTWALPYRSLKAEGFFRGPAAAVVH